ncbi:MAG TPA: hypothetical protein VE999_12200, partial [Gemmataceae bacterium]|nr:hypothetical protein [Gemmataceae bacterium]
MFSLTRLAKIGYVVALFAAISLLISANLSRAQFRGTPTIPGMPIIGGTVDQGGRIIGMPPPPMQIPLNNLNTDSTGGFTGMGMLGGMSGGMMGMMGMSGGMMGMSGGMMGMGGGMMGMGGGMMGMMGMGGGMMGMGGMMMGMG